MTARAKTIARRYLNASPSPSLKRAGASRPYPRDVACQHIKHPSQLLNQCDEVEAIVLKLDAENEKISLGLKQFPVDKDIQGTIPRLLMAFAGLVMSLFIRDAIHQMTAPSFWGAASIVPVIALAYVFQV